MRVAAALLTALLLLPLTGCGQQDAAADVDAAAVWLEGYLDADASRADAAAPYVADEVTVDEQYSNGVEVVGRSTYLQMGRAWCGDSCEEVTWGACYLGSTDAVVISSLEGEWAGERFVFPLLYHLVIGPQGIQARYERESTARLTDNPYGDQGRRANPAAQPGEDVAAAVLDEWPDGWTLDRAGDHHARGSTYDPDAPAVYVGLSGLYSETIAEVWMLVSHPSACPGRMAVRLTLDDDGSVRRQDVFPEIEALRACPDEAPDGWLVGREPPRPLAERVTGEVSVGETVIEVRHGTDGLERAIVWAMSRFDLLGLPAPPVASVAFDPYAPACDDALALSTFTGATTEILVCGDAETMCDEGGCQADRFARRVLLHEFAHAWLNAYVDEATEEAFTRLMGRPTWDETSQPWADRGIEWAAETLAWGLHLDPVGMFAFGDPSCPTLVDGFRLLTGVEPPHACP